MACSRPVIAFCVHIPARSFPGRFAGAGDFDGACTPWPLNVQLPRGIRERQSRPPAITGYTIFSAPLFVLRLYTIKGGPCKASCDSVRARKEPDTSEVETKKAARTKDAAKGVAALQNSFCSAIDPVVFAAITQTCRPSHGLWGGQSVEPRTLSLC